MILVRHGQTIFNRVYGATRVDPGVPDPALTEEGRGQARAAAAALAGEEIELILASPYRRALQTARIVAARLDRPVLIDDRARERCAFSCDVGSPRSDLARAWPDYDFSGLRETWWPADEESEAGFAVRCRTFARHWAGDPRWERIAAITHWGVIRALTGRRLANGELVKLPRRGGPGEVVRSGDPC